MASKLLGIVKYDTPGKKIIFCSQLSLKAPMYENIQLNITLYCIKLRSGLLLVPTMNLHKEHHSASP